MKLDWKEFCTVHGIEYLETGPNVGKGNINIRCPFCDDTSHHMGLKLTPERPFFGCWRCRASGAHPYRLLVALVGVPAARATLALAENSEAQAGVPDAFDSLLTKKDTPSLDTALIEKEKAMPSTFLSLGRAYAKGPTAALLPRYARPFGFYMNDRGFFGENLQILAMTEDLRYCLSGDYARRIILPVYFNGRLLSWVGRAIDKSATLRYKAEGHDLKPTLGGYDIAAFASDTRSKPLVVTEGPFDYLKMAYLLNSKKFLPVCTFGTAYTESQFALLARLARKFRATLILFDADARMQGSRLCDQLTEVIGERRFTTVSLPKQVKDPGDMTRDTLPYLLHNFRAAHLHLLGEE